MGLIQTIRLMLDRAALQQMQRDASAASKMVAEELTRELGNGKSAEKAVLSYATKLRSIFEQKTKELRDNLSKGLISVPEAQKAAAHLADTFTATLAKELKTGVGKNLGVKTKKAIMEAAIPKPEEMAFATQTMMSRYWSRMKAKFQMPDMKLLNIPDAQPITSQEQKELMSQAGGKISEFNRLQQQLQNQVRASGTELTRMGRIMRLIGVDAFKTSKEFQALGVRHKQIKLSAMELLAQGKPWQAFFSMMTTGIRRIGLGMVTATTAFRAFRTVKDSFVVAADAESTFARLGVTLADFGVTAQKAWPDVQILMQQLSGMGYTPTFTAEVLATLVQITGDYDQSLKAVVPTLDLVVARHMSWETAARVLGRAIIGDTGNIQRHGIFLDKYRDVLDQIIARFQGEALARSMTLRGQLDRASVSWWNFRNALGRVLADGMRTADMFKTLNMSLGVINEAVRSQSGIIIALVRVTNFLIKFIAMVVILFDSATTVIQGAWMAIVLLAKGAAAVGMEIAGGWNRMWRGMYSIALSTAHLIATAIKTMTLGVIDATTKIEEMQEANRKAQAENRRERIEGRSMRTQSIRTGATRLNMLFTGGIPEEPLGNPLITAQTMGNEGKIIAREAQRIKASILEHRRNALSDDEDRSLRAMTALNKIYDDQQKVLSELAENAGRRVEIENHLTLIEKVRSDLEAKNAAKERKRSSENKVNARIELLGRIAILDAQKESQEALAELAQLEKQFGDEVKKTTIGTERYFVLVDRILKIDQIRQSVGEKRWKDLKDEIEGLGERVELDVKRDEALKELAKIQEKLTRDAQDKTLSDAEQLNIQRALLDVQRAMGLDDDRTDTQIDRYRQWLTLAEKREMAESRLVALRKTLQDKLDKEVMTEQRQLRIRQQLKDVEDALADRFNLRDTARAVASLDDIGKNGMTRSQAIDMAIKLQERLNEAQEKGNLGLDEMAQVLALLERIRRRLITLQKPELDFWKDLTETFKTELIPTIEESAKKMADHVVSAFERMSSSLRDFGSNAKDALKSIPQSIVAAMTDGIRKIAMDKVKEHIAEAAGEAARGFGMLAKGNAKGAGLAFKSAAMHTLAAAKWGLLGGAAGAATTGLMGGGGADGKSAKAEKTQGPEIHLYIDGVDPNNARHQNLIGNTIRGYRERHGSDIVMHPRGGK